MISDLWSEAGSLRSHRSPTPEGIAERPECTGVSLAIGARIRIDRRPELDVDKTRFLDHGYPPCTRQGTSNSTGPQVDVALCPVRNLLADTDVCDLDAPSGAKNPEDLAVRGNLVGYQIENSV